MPQAIPPNTGPEFLANALLAIQQRLSALELAHKTGVVDAKGRLLIKEGFQSDGTYGIWICDTAGHVIQKIGQQADGTFGTDTLNAAGQIVIKTGDTGGGVYGSAYFDPAGHERVQIGQLPSGDYGLLITDPNTGQSAEIWPSVTALVGTSQGTTSTTYADLATVGPSVTVDVYATGNVLVDVSSYLGTPGLASAVNGAYVGVSVDGGAATDILQLQNSTPVGAAVGQAAQFGRRVEITGLTPGIHTFTLKYRVSAGGGTATFASRYLTVQPY